jgi:branched-chain amino acid transport system ATP-binding protein
MHFIEPALALKDVNAWYGESHVLHGVSLEVHTGECVSLLGRNGAGRTTLLRSILGLVDRREGQIRVLGRQTTQWPTHRIARLGIGYCPDERGIFSALTCEENLLLPPVLNQTGSEGLSLDEVYELFPNLRERRKSPGAKLSGGEQQMLALGRILRTGATLLLLDEISEGLAPVIVQTLARAIAQLKSKGYTIVLVEQNFRFAAPLADRMLVIEHGRVEEHIDRRELSAKMPRLHELLGV